MSTDQTLPNQTQPDTPTNAKVHPSDADGHPVATGLGAIGGGVMGAAVGHAIDKKIGPAIGGVVGAIAGGIAGNAVADMAEATIEDISPSISLGLGADSRPIELPAHYSREELQALSKPNGGQLQSH